jgi:hypothetical protein
MDFCSLATNTSTIARCSTVLPERMAEQPLLPTHLLATRGTLSTTILS